MIEKCKHTILDWGEIEQDDGNFIDTWTCAKCGVPFIPYNSITFQEARNKMANELTIDEGLYLGYQSNIAMYLHDNWEIVTVHDRNKAAKELIDLIFNS